MALDALNMLLLFLPLSLFFFTKKLKAVRQNNNLPPGPPKLPIIGNLHQLGTLPHQSLCKLAKIYGPVMLLQLGGVPTLVISSAEAAKVVLKVNDLNSCSRPLLPGARTLTYNYRDVGFTPYGDYWREMRKICVLELFSAKRVQSYRSIREEEVDSLINLISESSSSATPVNLTEMLFSLTASIVFRIAFGTTFERSGFNNHRFHQVVHDVQAMLGSYSAAEFIPYVGWIVDRLSGLHQRFERTFNELDRFFQYVVDNHLSAERTKTDHEDIIDVLLKLVREQTGFGAAQLSQDNIKAVLLNVFLGGVDTGAITMIWAMAELAKQPKLMKKAQDEVRTSIGNKGRVSESDIDQLEYLKMIVKETFRLHPPAALLLPRETISHFKVNGFEVHPKTTIHINAWAIGRDPGYWKSPEEFIPERFVDSSTDFKGQHFELLPFGSGRRVCPGIYMATTMVELGLANLLYWFDWKLPDGMKEEDINMEEEAGISLTISKKIALNLVPAKYSGTHQKIA
ncbi:cytochrome P450 71B34 isoform X1 [Ziziphus jujuba]|uniref:Cytochrome P450 71B34 isoform X1 n=1 Tax=Ziziphus jujuba TaxID=326968 RepID=A0A6P4AI65_ZIZJJ|nr:cytochrome P450 71B34 isoform X1 [Ziziphus jujuba]